MTSSMHEYALRIQGLQKVYKNGQNAVKGIDFNVKTGDFFALLGPNGAGKSSVIGMISSTVVKTAGTIEILVHNLDTHPFQAKSQLGVMPQEVNLNFFETPLQTLLNQAGYYGIRPAVARKRAEFLLAQLDLFQKKDQLTQRLSGGMKRRLMIARALIHDPKIVILDEPTAGVDVELRQMIWQFLSALNKEGLTIILTTHYLEEAEKLCRNLVLIHQGEIIRAGKMGHFMRELEEEQLVLELATPLTAIPIVPWKIELQDAYTLKVKVKKSQSLNALFETLSEHNIQVVSMRNEANRLEQLFIKLIQEQGK